jgi:hypothetical protein
VDLRGVRITDGDYEQSDLGAVLGQPRVHDAALALYRLSPRPALAYVCGPGPARALAAHLRLGGLRATHVDEGAPVETIRHHVAELVARRLDVLVSIKRLAGRQPVPGLAAVMLVLPTLRDEMHRRYIGRLQPVDGTVTIYDLVGNCARHGLPEDWDPTTMVGPPSEVVRDPCIRQTRRYAAPHRDGLGGPQYQSARTNSARKRLQTGLGLQRASHSTPRPPMSGGKQGAELELSFEQEKGPPPCATKAGRGL